jgi:hypothetical protein
VTILGEHLSPKQRGYSSDANLRHSERNPKTSYEGLDVQAVSPSITYFVLNLYKAFV